MSIYKPAKAPHAPPLIWSSEEIYSVPPSETTWRDFEIRRGMDVALRQNTTVVQEITKLLQESELTPLHTVRIVHPYVQPPVVYVPGCMSRSEEADNARLKDFAFDAYDSLSVHFGAAQWEYWFIAPFYSAGDDSHETYNLGVFVDEQFSSEMVE